SHSGWIWAAVRPHSRAVSASSVTMTQGGGLRASAESGNSANRALRAPANSISGRRLPRAGALGSVSRIPTCDSRPASSDRCTCWARPAGIGIRPFSSRSPSRPGAGRYRAPPFPAPLPAAAGAGGQAEAAARRPELAVQVLPLPDPQVVQVLALAHPAEGRRRQLALLFAQVVPQMQDGQEVRAGLGEPRLLGVVCLPDSCYS